MIEYTRRRESFLKRIIKRCRRIRWKRMTNGEVYDSNHERYEHNISN